MEAAKTGAPQHPKLPCNAVCKARQSCEQAPARHTSVKPSAIQGETAKARWIRRQTSFWAGAAKRATLSMRPAAPRRQPHIGVAIGSRQHRKRTARGQLGASSSGLPPEASSQRVTILPRNYEGRLHAPQHGTGRPPSATGTKTGWPMVHLAPALTMVSQ